MKVIIKKDYQEMSAAAARFVAEDIRKNTTGEGHFKLGLATGSTPLKLYSILVRMHREENLDFSSIVTFNLDEYMGIPPEHPCSYHYYVEKLIKHVNIKPENVNIPRGTAEAPQEECREYDRKIIEAGGIDLQTLGMGRNGHIGFNEPGTPFSSRTKTVRLADETIQDNARFFDSPADVPREAITMGIGTILEARKIILLVSGQHKADALKKALEGPLTEKVPASALRNHRQVTVICDKAAASKLKKTENDY